MKILKVIGVVVLVALIATVAYGVVLVRRGFSAQAEPSAVEKLVARQVRNMAIPADASTLTNPWKDKFTPDVMAYARHHFADHCATCHANDGSGQGAEMGQGFYPKPPNMRLPATQNLTDGELYYIIENGVRLTGMPAWGDPDSTKPNGDDDSWQLVMFIRHLPTLSADELKDMEHYNPTGPFDEEEEQHEQGQAETGHHHH